MNPPNVAYSPSEALPQHLAHKPIYAFPYEHFDGIYAEGTDVKYISVGIAQYDCESISIKTMRYTGEKWTRQAEELPLHRVIDMTLFLAKVLFENQNETVKIPKETFLSQESDILIRKESRSYGEMATYKEFIKENGQLLKDRFNVLRNVLDDLAGRGLL
jgi:hypothetical protein